MSANIMDIKDKIAIVTGASQGIGLQIAKKLSEAGAKVVLASRSEDKLAEAAKELPDSLDVATDMRRPEDVRNLIGKTLQKYGRVDILVNNAGQGMYGPVETIDIEKHKQLMELNFYGVLRAMQEVIPVMRKQGGGLILNISSRVSKNYFPELSAYSSTKYALNAISLTARQELSKDHIVISVFHPRMTETNFHKNSLSKPPERMQNGALDRSALPVDSPEQVAEKVLLLIQSEEPEGSM
jgi:short-subunit dehydrogenase